MQLLNACLHIKILPFLPNFTPIAPPCSQDTASVIAALLADDGSAESLSLCLGLFIASALTEACHREGREPQTTINQSMAEPTANIGPGDADLKLIIVAVITINVLNRRVNGSAWYRRGTVHVLTQTGKSPPLWNYRESNLHFSKDKPDLSVKMSMS